MLDKIKKMGATVKPYSENTRLKSWRKISESVEKVNPFWTYRIDNFTLPDGTAGEYHYVHSVGSVFIVPVLDNGQLLMLRQYRYLNRRFSLEFPGGGMCPGQTAGESAQRELIEETGYRGVLEKIGQFNPFNGVTDETTHVFLARGLSPSTEFSPDGSEDFELFKLPPNQLDELIHKGKIFDGMTLSAWMLAKDRITKS